MLSSHFSVTTAQAAARATAPPGKLAVMVPGRKEWPEGTFVGSLPEAERATLLAAGTPVRFEDDQIMLVQGDTGDFAYVLTGGLVKVVVAAVSGVETTLAIRSRGDLVGEFALLDEKPRTATVRAAGEATALRVSAATFLAVTRGSWAARTATTSYVMGKLRETTERRAAERVWDARERLAQVLYELGRDRAEPGPDGAIRIPLTQSDLGDLAGVAVSTAERILKDLRRQGVISTRYREVAIKDMAQLDGMRFSG